MTWLMTFTLPSDKSCRASSTYEYTGSARRAAGVVGIWISPPVEASEVVLAFAADGVALADAFDLSLFEQPTAIVASSATGIRNCFMIGPHSDSGLDVRGDGLLR